MEEIEKKSVYSNELSKSKIESKKKPDGGYGWIILLSAFLISFFLDGIMYSFGIVLKEIKLYYDSREDVTNLITAFNTGFQFLSGTLSAALAKQFGVRKVVMISAIIFSLMYVISAFSPSIILIIICFGVLGGVAFGCTYLTCFILLVDYFDKKLGIANGLLMAGSGLGAFAMPPFIQFCIMHIGWKYTMLVLGGLTLICSLLGALLKPIESSENYEMVKTDDANDDSNQSKSIIVEILKEMTNFKILKENMPFLLISISNFFLFFGYFIPFIYIPRRAGTELKFEKFSLIISTMGITNIPCRIIFGFLADRFSALTMNVFAIFLATLSIFAYYWLLEFWMQIVFAIFFGIAMAGFNCLTTKYVLMITSNEQFANANGITYMVRGIGCFIGPFIGGFIFDSTQNLLYTFIFSGCSFAIAFSFALITFLLVKIKHPEIKMRL